METILPLSSLLSFKGKKVLITGSSSGIGKATAMRFAEAGAELLLLNRSLPDEKMPEYAEKSPKVRFFAVDVGVKEQVDKFWSELKDDELPDIIVNNAGIYPIKEFLEVDEAFLDKVLDVNMNSVFWMSQNFVQRRRALKLGGNMINISSIEAVLPMTKHMVHYSTSKAGVIAITRSVARDYGKDGFKANAIMPGGIMTEGTRSTQMDALIHLRFDLFKAGYDFAQRLTMGRWGEPDEIAKVALFLASDMASYMNGAVVPVDGGFTSS